jgi:AcrR family transcriptional regulator
VKEESRQISCPLGVPEWIASHHRHERRDAAEHRQLILDVAQHLFGEHGVDAVSMHQIALAAGIGQGTLYRRYRHKGELCMDLMRERYERFVEDIAAMLDASGAASTLERLDSVLLKMVALLEEQGTMLEPVAETMMRDARCEASDSSRRFSFHQSPWYLWLHELLAGLLTQAVERGELASLDVPYTTDAILALLNPPFYLFQRQERGFSQERILQGVRRLYIECVKTPSRAGEEIAS